MENERKITAMGMAAGQARLLSITARMSDNELRAQIINNNKMRLATESSQVSENYVQALNEAELMFTNYDADNNASFKQLTFNSLTAYNPYNNQYALTNASGNILLSETDYKNYEKTKDKGLDEFLKCYGLEQTTTYFKNLTVGDDGFVVFTNPDVEDDPTTPINETTNQSTGLTQEQLYLAYLGNEEYKKVKGLTDDQKITMRSGVDVIPNGYDVTQNSELYNQYFRYLDKYNETYENFLSSLSAIMDRTLNQIIKDVSDNRFDGISSILDASDRTDDKSQMKTYMEMLYDAIEGKTSPAVAGARDTGTYALSDQEVQDYYDMLETLLQGNWDSDITKGPYTIAKDPSGTTKLQCNYFTYDIVHDTTSTVSDYVADYVQFYEQDGVTASVQKTLPKFKRGSDYPAIVGPVDTTVTDADGNDVTIGVALKIDYDPATKEYTVYEILKDQNNINNMRDTLKSVAKSLKSSVKNCWDPLKTVFTSQEPAATYFATYTEAAMELGKIIYGSSYSGANPAINELGDPYVLYNAIGQVYHNPVDGRDYGSFPNFDNDFYQVYLNIILDKVQDTYGEPYFTWIDTSSPDASYNENGEAKAKWYENIWNMCEKNGYRVIKDGLASSTDWMQYAFESGIVNLQQVDSNRNWNPLIYSNCSDITSQTSDKKVAQAEAEYNAAMNKIENKDKRYDLELKNIDTEHNSLQTEYESIKSAIDKHIERVFKLYS